MNPLAELLGDSRGIVDLRDKIGRVLRSRADRHRLPPILLQGETGTGKGLLARAIHRASARRDGPFVDVNCAAIPEALLESEMFGFEHGAFTDARRPKPGLFQTAHRGTIFLDEIGLLPERLQAKLLKVIEERTVRRLGSTRDQAVDVWILAAGNEDLAKAVRARRFREDLYHRLAVLTIWLPPLRERERDALLLAEHFLARACSLYALPPRTLAPDARAVICDYPWPGNVRELSNVMERAALLSEATVVTADALELRGAPVTPSRGSTAAEQARRLEDSERDHLLKALEGADWNIARAAAQLAISRKTLRFRVKEYGLRPAARVPPRRPHTPQLSGPATAESAAPQSVRSLVGIRWERRPLAFLRAVLVAPSGEDRALVFSRPLEILVEKVQSFGGRVEQLGPTSVLAAFGTQPMEDAARRAALCAVSLQRALKHDDGTYTLHAGIHFGPFMVGTVGGVPVVDEEATREASRVLEEVLERADPTSIMVSEAAASLLQRRFELLPAGELRRTWGRAYRLAGPEQTGFGLGGRVTRFVGRHAELGFLRGKFDEAKSGHAEVVAIVGEAGIGKSRLLFEFRQALSGDHRATYLEGRCRSHGEAIPYLPLLDVLRRSCGATEADSAAEIATKVRTRLRQLGMHPDDGAPYLLHLLGVNEGTERLAMLSPETVKARAFQTLRQMILTDASQVLVILAIEDLHWIDTTSEEFLGSLVDSVATSPILLVLTYRPGYRLPWVGKSYTTQIALGPLSSQDSLSVVRSVVVEQTPLPEPLAEAVLSKAEGNPFFLEELTRAVMDRGDLGTGVVVPDTIQEVLLSRIDGLPDDTKRVLQTAAVIGKDVPFGILRAVVDLPADVLRRGLGQLQTTEFLYARNRFADPEYTFKHALTHEVAYASLLPERRRITHARVAYAIEALCADRLSEHVERLGRHSFLGELWEKALQYCRQAGAKAVDRSADREAVAWFEQALAALAQLPKSRESVERAIDLRLDLRSALHALGEFERLAEYLSEAEALAETLGDRRRLGWIFGYVTHLYSFMGDYPRAIECGQRALAIAEPIEDRGLLLMASHYLGLVHWFQGDYQRAVDCLRRTVESIDGDLIRERFGLPIFPAVFSRAFLALSLAELGEFADGMGSAEDGVRIAEAVSHPYSQIFADFGVGYLYFRKGDLDRAIPRLEHGLTLWRVTDIRLLFPFVTLLLGSAYAYSGRLSEAVALAGQAVEAGISMRVMSGRSLGLGLQGEVYLLAGRTDDAVELAGRALDLSRANRERGNEAWTLRLLGEIASHRDPPDAENAEVHYRRAMVLATELGMRPLAAHCHLGLGRLYRQTGRREQAEEHLTAATTLFREMDMRFWLDQAEAAVEDRS